MRAILLTYPPEVARSWEKSTADVFDGVGGNTGNLAFVYAAQSLIQNIVAILPWGTPAKALKATGDIVIISCANQLGSHTDLGGLANILEEAGLPVVCLGLGAQAARWGDKVELTEGTLKWLNVVASLSAYEGPNIGVRGQYTLDVLDDYGLGKNGIVTGCPSNMISSDKELGQRVQTKFEKGVFNRICVAAGIPHLPSLKNIEYDLIKIMEEKSGQYIVQHSLGMVHIARGSFDEMSETEFQLHRNYMKPDLNDEEYKLWCQRYALAFTSANAWMEYLLKFDLVIGTRFHGVMLAIQAGVPGVVITHDSRTEEMCRTMEIPYIEADKLESGFDLSDIIGLKSFNGSQYYERRMELYGRMEKVLDKSGISIRSRFDGWAGKS